MVKCQAVLWEEKGQVIKEPKGSICKVPRWRQMKSIPLGKLQFHTFRVSKSNKEQRIWKAVHFKSFFPNPTPCLPSGNQHMRRLQALIGRKSGKETISPYSELLDKDGEQESPL